MNAIAKGILFVGVCSALAIGGTAAQAETTQVWAAKWKPQYASAPPAVQEWYRSQRNSRGGFCCDQADGDAYYGNYRLNADGSVTLGDGTNIPKWQVLSGNNPTGHAVWWHYKNVISYCFSPGPLI